MRNAPATLGVAAILLAASAASAQTFQPLGPTDFGEDYVLYMPRGLSYDGSVIAGDSYGATNQAFLWVAGSATGLGFLPGAPANATSAASAVSGDGLSVVGWSTSPPDGSGQNRTEPFRWQDGSMISLGRLDNTRNRLTQATAVNGDGTVVVGWDQLAPTGISAWRWTQSGGIQDLGALPGAATGSAARGVTPDGLTVYGDGDTGSGDNVVWRWRDGVMENLGDIPGGNTNATPFAASHDGNVIVGRGSSFQSGVGNVYEAFRYANGTMTGLGDLPGGEWLSEAYGTTADGSIVVGFSGTDSDEERSAFIWDEVNGMRDLRQVLIDEYGMTELAEWQLTVAYGISADGRTIIGDGVTPKGAFQGWVVTIPEPSSVALLCVGSLIPALRRRRVAR